MASHQLFAVLGLNLELPLVWACTELFRGGMERTYVCDYEDGDRNHCTFAAKIHIRHQYQIKFVEIGGEQESTDEILMFCSCHETMDI